MYAAMYVLCGTYLYFQERQLLTDTRRIATMLGLVVLTVLLCRVVAGDRWRAEVIPMTLFGITVAIAYRRELALLLSVADRAVGEQAGVGPVNVLNPACRFKLRLRVEAAPG